MSDIKKIKDEFINKLKEDLDLNSVNQIKTDLFGKNGKISNEFKKLGSVAAQDRKKFASDLNSIKDELQVAISDKIKDPLFEILFLINLTMSPVPPARSKTLKFSLKPDVSIVTFFHNLWMPKDIKSFIKS